MTGRVPGRPRQTGQTRVFGSSVPLSGGAVGQVQNIFDSVRSCAWTSIPMTVSYFVPVLTVTSPIVRSGGRLHATTLNPTEPGLRRYWCHPVQPTRPGLAFDPNWCHPVQPAAAPEALCSAAMKIG